MSRTITLIAVIQLFLVIIGFLALGVVMKWNGYPEELSLRWTPLALRLRHHGLYLLLWPVLWAVFAAIAGYRSSLIFTLDVWMLLGVVSMAAITGLFLYASVQPYTRPMLYYLDH